MNSTRLILSVWLLLHDRAIDHPGFRYQSRKPSEKKKRMTKNKLAKLAAKSEVQQHRHYHGCDHSPSLIRCE